MVANREEILSRLRESKRSLQAEFPLKRIALFGSYAMATQVPGLFCRRNVPRLKPWRAHHLPIAKVELGDEVVTFCAHESI